MDNWIYNVPTNGYTTLILSIVLKTDSKARLTR